MMNLLRRLVRDEEGQGLVEYGLIIVLISIAVIGTLTLIAPQLDALFTRTANELTPP